MKVIKAKLGGFEYRVIFRHDSDDDFGKTCLAEKTIWINDRYSKQVQRETLLHELLHVALEDCPLVEFPIDKKGDMEEALVRFISPRMFQFLQDNPKLKQFIWGGK